jgi:regulatory protein
MVGEERFEVAKDQAYEFLRRRERSEREVRDHLRGKGHDVEVVEAVIQRLQELDYVNDRRFAQLWVKNRAFSKQKGSEFLKKELLEKGISLGLIEDIVEAEFDPGNEYVVALECAKKKLKSYPKDPDTWKGKLWRFLTQRGFQSEIIADVIATLLAGENQD